MTILIGQDSYTFEIYPCDGSLNEVDVYKNGANIGEMIGIDTNNNETFKSQFLLWLSDNA